MRRSFTSATDLPTRTRSRIEVGIHYLEANVPSEAITNLRAAKAAGLHEARIDFYLALALLSGRSLHQLSDEERNELIACVRQEWPDEYGAQLREIRRLLLLPRSAEGSDLPDGTRNHLESLLNDAEQERIWLAALAEARREHRRDNRERRVPLFFEADPVKPRPINVAEPIFEPRPQFAVALGIPAAALLWLVITGVAMDFNALLAAPAMLLTAVSGYFATAELVRWKTDSLRFTDEMSALSAPALRRAPPKDGFAHQMDQLFERHSRERAPAGYDIAQWLNDTAALRAGLRGEIVHAYRDSDTTAPELTWLVRHVIDDVAARYQRGAHIPRPPNPLNGIDMMLWTMAGLAGAVLLARGALMGNVLLTLPTLLLALGATAVAAGAGIEILAAKERYRHRLIEASEVQKRRWEAWHAWSVALKDRPSDEEMARWLRYDRIRALATAIRHYKLTRRQLLHPTVLATQAPGSARAQEQNGPWRYSRYALHAFLLTSTGVRQFDMASDMATGSLSGQRRLNFRFDAVTAIKVSRHSHGNMVKLSLNNGAPIPIRAQGGGDIDDNVTLESGGFKRTLHILEGIAAEGDKWLDNEDQREGDIAVEIAKRLAAR